MSAKRDPKIFLAHILECIEKIEGNIGDLSERQFLASTTIQDAVVRRLEIIGEAAKNLPESFTRKYVDIPWKKMAGLRDVLIHEYFGVEVRLVWKIATKDIPQLKKQITQLLERIS